MNVIGSRPDGWWRDRPAAQRRLYDRLARQAGAAADVVVVFEGDALSDLPEGVGGAVGVRWARRRGRDAADDRIVEEVVAGCAEGRPVTVVTADRDLRRRVERAGGRSVGTRQLDAALAGGA